MTTIEEKRQHLRNLIRESGGRFPYDKLIEIYPNDAFEIILPLEFLLDDDRKITIHKDRQVPYEVSCI